MCVVGTRRRSAEKVSSFKVLSGNNETLCVDSNDTGTVVEATKRVAARDVEPGTRASTLVSTVFSADDIKAAVGTSIEDFLR